jgi:hypothetical protein
VFTSDKGPEDTRPWRGWAGPWSGFYSIAMEGSLRLPCMMRWPGKVPEVVMVNGRVLREISTTCQRLRSGRTKHIQPKTSVQLRQPDYEHEAIRKFRSLSR